MNAGWFIQVSPLTPQMMAANLKVSRRYGRVYGQADVEVVVLTALSAVDGCAARSTSRRGDLEVLGGTTWAARWDACWVALRAGLSAVNRWCIALSTGLPAVNR